MIEKERIDRRRMYVKAWLQGVKNKPTEIKRLSLKLFVSERTIYQDLAS